MMYKIHYLNTEYSLNTKIFIFLLEIKIKVTNDKTKSVQMMRIRGKKRESTTLFFPFTGTFGEMESVFVTQWIFASGKLFETRVFIAIIHPF